MVIDTWEASGVRWRTVGEADAIRLESVREGGVCEILRWSGDDLLASRVVGADADGLRVLDCTGRDRPVLVRLSADGAREELDREPEIVAPATRTLRARDGSPLDVYVDGEGDRGALVAHAGPWQRDTADLPPMARDLVAVGYRVLRVNFRGSSGYGKAWLNGANRDWDGAPIRDLADAVEQVFDGPILAYGGSFGGYAALALAKQRPDLVRAVAAVCPPVDLLADVRRRVDRSPATACVVRWCIGDPEAAAERLRTALPLWWASDLRVPVLLASAGNDALVPADEVAALAEALPDGEYAPHPQDGHGLTIGESRRAWRARVLAFGRR